MPHTRGVPGAPTVPCGVCAGRLGPCRRRHHLHLGLDGRTDTAVCRARSSLRAHAGERGSNDAPDPSVSVGRHAGSRRLCSVRQGQGALTTRVGSTRTYWALTGCPALCLVSE